jgi:hypothetical protein
VAARLRGHFYLCIQGVVLGFQGFAPVQQILHFRCGTRGLTPLRQSSQNRSAKFISLLRSQPRNDTLNAFGMLLLAPPSQYSLRQCRMLCAIFAENLSNINALL